MRAYRRGALIAGVLAVIGATLLYVRSADDGERSLTDPAVEARETAASESDPPTWATAQLKPKAKIVSAAERDDLIHRAQVWREPSVPIAEADLGDPTPARFVPCRFRVSALGGTAPKFDCDLESGEVVRIKYGRTGEVPGEVAATRLLRTLGFGADVVTYVEQLRCYGCPKEPFSVMKAVEITHAEKLYKGLMLSYDSSEDFEWPALERKFDARAIETDRLSGWAMFELDKVQASKGGAPPAHLDAFRLLSVFLAHWDNKSDNQRLVCLSPSDWGEGQRCEKPFLLLQDVGSTFGPSKVHLEKWKKVSIWDDRAACTTSMHKLPYDGATFPPVKISEAGRRFLADMLTRLSDRQVTDLFTSARFDEKLGILGRNSAIAEWVTVFKDKVRAIADGPPCGTT